MTYMPFNIMPHSPLVSYMTEESGIGFGSLTLISQAPASNSWPTANKAFFYPIRLRYPVTIYSLWKTNGSTAANNFDIGVYASDGTKIVSTGSVAQSGTSTIQVVPITPLTIGPGVFYLALAMNGTSGTVMSMNPGTLTYSPLLGVFGQTSCFPLLQNATFATQSSIIAFMCVFGFSTIPFGSGQPLLFVNVNDKTTTSENHTP